MTDRNDGLESRTDSIKHRVPIRYNSPPIPSSSTFPKPTSPDALLHTLKSDDLESFGDLPMDQSCDATFLPLSSWRSLDCFLLQTKSLQLLPFDLGLLDVSFNEFFVHPDPIGLPRRFGRTGLTLIQHSVSVFSWLRSYHRPYYGRTLPTRTSMQRISGGGWTSREISVHNLKLLYQEDLCMYSYAVFMKILSMLRFKEVKEVGTCLTLLASTAESAELQGVLKVHWQVNLKTSA